LEGITPYEYLQSIELIPVAKDSAFNYAREIKRLWARRHLIQKCKKIEDELSKKQDLTGEQMVSLVDKHLTETNLQFCQQETQNIFESIIENIEEIGNDPKSVENFGYMGPFESINLTLGSLSYESAMVCVGARTGNGKSSLGFYYNTYVAEKYGLPVLHLDAGEMSVKDLQMRAVCSLSNGRVPLWAIETGEWRKNKAWSQIIREDVWPRVKKINTYYQNISGMDAKEFVSFIKRFYFNKIGRGNHLLIHWDYIKGLESIAKNTQEYQSIGYMIGDLKSLITTEIKSSVWTSVQNNKLGIYNGKDAKSVNDSEESYSLSDRIIQQCTNAFTMRYKLPEEITDEGNMFGNVILKSTKERKLLGKNFQEMLDPVRVMEKDQMGKPYPKYKKNYFNLESSNFFYRDMGSLKDMMVKMGKTPLKTGSGDDNQPAF
jgi:hypothetical protein